MLFYVLTVVIFLAHHNQVPVVGARIGNSMARPAVRKLQIGGAPYDRGVQHGSQTPDLVRKGVDFYVNMWEQNTGGSRAEVLELVAGFADPIREFDSEILSEIEGIAAGAEVSLEEVLLINARYELMIATVFDNESNGSPGECTSLAAASEATGGHTLIAQNWDWTVEAGERSILVEIRQDGRPDLLTHVEAGMIGHKGLNTAGLGLCANAMSSHHDRFAPAVPVWVQARAALNCESLDEVEETMNQAQRTASVNFTVGSTRGEIGAVEVTPKDVKVVTPTRGRVSHGNVFAGLSPERDVEDRLAVLYPQFCDRARRAEELVQQEGISVERVKSVLVDHENRPESICRHWEDAPGDTPEGLLLETVASVIMDLNEGKLWVTAGPPCQESYAEHVL